MAASAFSAFVKPIRSRCRITETEFFQSSLNSAETPAHRREAHVVEGNWQPVFLVVSSFPALSMQTGGTSARSIQKLKDLRLATTARGTRSSWPTMQFREASARAARGSQREVLFPPVE